MLSLTKAPLRKLLPIHRFYKNRIEYGILKQTLQLTKFDLKRIKGQFLPTLSANAAYTIVSKQ
jgi:hypothetical protein